MTPHFKSQLVVRLVDHRNGGNWRLELPLVYRSAIAGLIVVPAGFETDFASVPRFLFTYLLTGNTAHAAAVIHDYLYRTPSEHFSRKTADAVMDEAMGVTGVPGWRRGLIHSGIRIGGSGAFKPRSRPI